GSIGRTDGKIAGVAESRQYSLRELARLLDVDFVGDPDALLRGLATLGSAGPGQLSFFHNARYLQALRETRAGAVILHRDHLDKCPTNALLAERPYLCFARASHLFERRPALAAGIHPTAVVPHSAVVDPSAVLGPGVVLGERARIGARTRLG